MKNKAPSIIHFIDRFRNAIILASIFVGSVTTYYGATQVIKTAPRASGTGSVCSASGCPEGQHCTTGSQWCEVYTGCVSGKAQLKVYFCDATSGAAAAKWVYKGTQDGKNACSFPQCSSSTISITPASCPCQGGAYTIGFKTNRKLNSGENISCTVSSSGTCACAGGKACDNSRKDGSCNISSGSDSCSVPNLDCSCKPYNYNCTGTASKQGSFAQAKNGGGDTVNLTLSTPTTAPHTRSTD